WAALRRILIAITHLTRTVSARDRPGGVDQPDVAERLGEVPQELAAVRIDLFGQQPDIVRIDGRRLERGGRSIDLTCERPCLREPERAQEKRAFLTVEAIG